VIYLDTETYSETPINHGTWRYLENAEVMVVTYAFDDGPVQVWDATVSPLWPGDLEYALFDDDDLITAHNAAFDRTLFNMAGLLRGFGKEIALERWRCTMARALAHSLPGSLDKLCEILKVDQDQRKLKSGKELIHLFCKPRPKNAKIRRATRHTHPEEWARFLEYATADIASMRVLDRKLPTWNYRGAELDLWHRDQRINDRGFAVDTGLAEAAVRAVDREQKELAARCYDITNEEVEKATQRDAMLVHILAEYGVDLPDMTKSTLERRISDPDLPIELRELLEIRLQACTSSTSKYRSLLRGVGSDGRLHHTKQFCGASRTGRWAGRTFQPDNLPRPKIGKLQDDALQAAIDDGIDCLKADCLDLVVDDVMEVTSAAIRGVIVAGPGKKLVVGDLANIEGRALAWLAGEEWKLDAFRAYDAGTGPDLYKLAYAKAFRIDPAEVNKHQRQIGKVMELMLGYEGGVGAFLTGSLTYGFDIEEMSAGAFDTLPGDIVREAREFLEWTRKQKRSTFCLSDRAFIVCDAFKRMWRYAHPATVQFWKDLKLGVITAIENPGETVTVRALKIGCTGAWLRIRLPSGRYLCYPNPRVGENNTISYTGVNQYTRKWGRIKTYGGKLAENITQAFARDMLVAPWPVIEGAGYDIVLHVHDENVTEAPDSPDYNAETLAKLMSAPIDWAPGLPLSAAAFETHRYRKD
jgi:DNA polymerase